MTGHSPDDSDDVLEATREFSRDSTPVHDKIETPLPTRIGRYAVRGSLGRGGFADVLLAHDEQLDRQIALKLPRRDRFQNESQLRAFVEEARTAARLQHPGIVTVFDVGFEGETPFIVLEYIRGRSLAHLLEHESLSSLAAAQLVAEVAEALAIAHEQGFVHRDIKPQNILLDTDDRPHIADFGLAVRHREQTNVSGDVAGTTHYMSPEQVRGENHRIDGRTDLWAVGVVFYRILTGRLPFTGSSPQEVFQQILYTDPAAPRQIDPNIPSELERICFRCLCQQMSGRYRQTSDLSDELSEWIRFTTGGSGSSLRRRGTYIEPPDAPVIPRGLRAFTQEDRDFFLKLIPGPRDRDGLPTPIRFWKNLIEERESDETFTVGLLYGPSGCGKSSLIKAGVLPRLNSDVQPLYVDVTSHDVELRILRLLQRKFKSLSHDLGLADSLRQLRERSELRSGEKVVLVLDQFEQWLHRWQSGADAEMVRALLQCDGGNVQCVLMVRDDFWLPVSRFMRQLELGIVDGTNAMLVDSFDPDHAQRVLRELGIAYKRLPANPTEQTEKHAAFIAQATEDLAENHRLYPVRLAVFVEMVKDREWVPGTLEEMGGTQGVGVAFLENSVGSRARPARRVHEQAARGVLGALLPKTGQIKDNVRTRSELLEISQYVGRPKDFDDLMHLLDVDLRLLTPARSADEDTYNQAGDSTSNHKLISEPTYQLTHDFLVPSIREWLDCQLRGSRQGRARLLLQEQSELWNHRPSHRLLPSLLEWLSMRLQTDRGEWTSSQSKMMNAASRRIIRQASVVMFVLMVGSLVAAVVFRQAERRWRAHEAVVLVSRLADVDIEDVPQVVDEMKPYREWIDPALSDTLADASQTERNRIRAAVASLPATNEHVSWLTNELTSTALSPRDFPVIRDALASRPEGVADQLRQKLADDTLPTQVRFRVACALAAFDDSAETWGGISDEVAASLLREQAAFSLTWIHALEPVSRHLCDSVEAELSRTETLEKARIGALFLAELGTDGLSALVDGLAAASGTQYRAIVEQLRVDPQNSLALVLPKVEELNAQELEGEQLETHREQQANLVVASFELGDRTLLSDASTLAADPRLRTYIVNAMGPERIDFTTILTLIFDEYEDRALRSVALLAALQHADLPLMSTLHDRLTEHLLQIYRDDSDSESHSVCGQLLRKLSCDVTTEDRALAKRAFDSTRDWYVNEAGQTMVILRPRHFHVDGYVAPEELTYEFAISSTEVRLDSFREFNQDHVQEETYQVGDVNLPAVSVLIVQAAKYCNWLNRKEGIPEREWCYPGDSELTVKNCFPLPGFESKSGYRLPLSVEWEYACRAGSTTSRFFGENIRLMNLYGWHQQSSKGLIRPVAQLLPNAFGLFDTYGNADENCIEDVNTRRYVSRGGNCAMVADELDSSTTTPNFPQALSHRQGFRVVRRLANQPDGK